MDSAKEKDIKDRVTDVWKKEMIRVQNIPNGWTEKRVTLGNGLTNYREKKLEKMLKVIEDFGIKVEILKAMEPTYDTICQVYESIKAYRLAVRYLKELKEHMGTFINFKGWRDNHDASL